MTQYFYTSEGHDVARLNETSSEYNNAETLRDGKWEEAFPADLLWNMEPVSKAKALHLVVKWSPQPITEARALELMNGVTA